METPISRPLDEIGGFARRLAFALGPLGVGIILDALDAMTFGPLGIVAGAVVGGFAGWILGGYEGFDRRLRLAFAIGAGIYMTVPLTEAIPVATGLILMSRFFQGPDSSDSA